MIFWYKNCAVFFTLIWLPIFSTVHYVSCPSQEDLPDEKIHAWSLPGRWYQIARSSYSSVGSITECCVYNIGPLKPYYYSDGMIRFRLEMDCSTEFGFMHRSGILGMDHMQYNIDTPFSQFYLQMESNNMQEDTISPKIDMHVLGYEQDKYIVLYSCSETNTTLFGSQAVQEHAWVLLWDPELSKSIEVKESVDEVLSYTNIGKQAGPEIVRTWMSFCKT